MKIALNTYTGYGNFFALRLMSEGNSVDVFLSDPKYQDILSGLIRPKIIKLDHRQHDNNYHDSLPDYSKYDLSVFDLTGKARQADYSFSQCPTIGDGSFQCILENNRAKGIAFMKEAGISIPPTEEFDDINKAKAFIKKTGKRYVFKADGGQDLDVASSYVSKSAEDLLKYLDKVFELAHGHKFILQEFVKGIEISIEGWWNGSDFYCLNATLEEKKFMAGGLGPNTGCAGNLVFTVNPETKLYKVGLGKLKTLLSQTNFRGMLDLNTIVTLENAYGLEFTPRFGYDASATLFSMYSGGLGNLLLATAKGGAPENSWKAEFGASVRLSIPPYPTELRLKREEGIEIEGLDIEDQEEMLNTYLYDVKLENKKLVTAGINGFIAAPIETGSSIPEAFYKLEQRVKNKLQIPDMQYRNDIMDRCEKRYYELLKLGWI